MVKKKTNESTLEKPIWLKMTSDEVIAIILKLANKGMSAEKIGLTLRDQYGIPDVKIFGLKIKKVLVEKGKYTEPTTQNLENKLVSIINHYKKNKQDKKAERSLIITKAKLKKRLDYQDKKTLSR